MLIFDSVDRAEIYTLDVYGYINKVENDLGNNGAVDSNIQYVRDNLGRVLQQLTDSNNDNVIDTRETYILDEYDNRLITSTDHGDDGSINVYSTAKYNALNQAIEVYLDRTGNGVTNDDTTYHRVYNEQGLKIEERFTRGGQTEPYAVNYFSEFNALNIATKETWDTGLNGWGPNDYIITKVAFSSLWPTRTTEQRIEYYDRTETREMEYDNIGGFLRTYIDRNNDNIVDTLAYGNGNAANASNFNDDLTAWNESQLARITGLTQIALSNASAQTIITLDKVTLSKIAPKDSTLIITGESQDKVNLIGFSKADTSDKSGYLKYIADDDVVYIQNAIGEDNILLS